MSVCVCVFVRCVYRSPRRLRTATRAASNGLSLKPYDSGADPGLGEGGGMGAGRNGGTFSPSRVAALIMTS